MFEDEKIIGEALTYDDVLIVPRYSEVLPRETDLRTKLTQTIWLNIPILSAAMDTVTEAPMAIAIAREGGLGVIHKNMSIEIQVDQVDRVKRSESGMIMNPITLGPQNTIRDALELMAKFHISGIPIVDNTKKLIGIVTNRDLRFNPALDTPIEEVMTKENLITVPEGTTLEQAERILQENRIEKLPVVDKNFIL
ncbi:MAG: IMP dehydrogenase, partial [Candidatus Kapaibacteriota bacterium]